MIGTGHSLTCISPSLYSSPPLQWTCTHQTVVRDGWHTPSQLTTHNFSLKIAQHVSIFLLSKILFSLMPQKHVLTSFWASTITNNMCVNHHIRPYLNSFHKWMYWSFLIFIIYSVISSIRKVHVIKVKDCTLLSFYESFYKSKCRMWWLTHT